MKALGLVVLLFPILIFSQEKVDCSSDYFIAFSNWVNFNDSVSYNLTNSSTLTPNSDCLNDTVSLISFLLNNELFAEFNNLDSSKKMKGLEYIVSCNFVNNTTYLKVEESTDPFAFNQTTNVTKRTSYASLDVLKLYFISALYYNDFGFKKTIRLQQGNTEATVNINQLKMASTEATLIEIVNQKVLFKAWKSCSKWLEQVEEKGMGYVRENNIDPLYYAKKIEWGE